LNKLISNNNSLTRIEEAKKTTAIQKVD
jgi:hypothetical protein